MRRFILRISALQLHAGKNGIVIESAEVMRLVPEGREWRPARTLGAGPNNRSPTLLQPL